MTRVVVPCESREENVVIQSSILEVEGRENLRCQLRKKESVVS